MSDQILIYGKIIIDSIRLRSGELVRSALGGGGPQAIFGARLWHESVGLLTRSGADLEPEHEQSLRALGADLSGWQRYDDLPTSRGLMEYDDNEQQIAVGMANSREDWFSLLARPIPLSESQRQAAALHLITEFAHEPMVADALDLQRRGALFSLEPIFAPHSCSDRPSLLRIAAQADLVTPDWPAASSLAGSEDLPTVLRFWAGLGARAVAIRHGAHGSYVIDCASQRAWHLPILPVELVDPTGAGNAYGGGWCAGWLASHDARVAGCYGAVAATIMVGHQGMPALTDAIRQQAADLLPLALERAAPLPSFEF